MIYFTSSKINLTIESSETILLTDAVLDCWWMDQKPECVVKASIEYNRTVNRHLSITLRQVTFANSGVYACQVHGYDPSSYKTCDLQIKTGTYCFKLQLKCYVH